MNGAIQVLVIERVLIVPKPGIWSRHLVTNEPDTIVAWIGSLTVAPVQALMAGCSRTVEPTGLKLNG